MEVSALLDVIIVVTNIDDYPGAVGVLQSTVDLYIDVYWRTQERHLKCEKLMCKHFQNESELHFQASKPTNSLCYPQIVKELQQHSAVKNGVLHLTPIQFVEVLNRACRVLIADKRTNPHARQCGGFGNNIVIDLGR